MFGNYKEHAAVWDWDAFDNTGEYEFWCKWALNYGKNVLIPMCALGENGAYMAGKGFTVTAFDVSKEMIHEGNKRFGEIPNLKLIHGNICAFNFDIEPIDFVFVKDIFHLLKIEDVRNAFMSIKKHLRPGGCMTLVMELPAKENFSWQRRTYHPRKERYFDKKVWKTGEGHYNAETKIKHISQTIFIKDKNGLKTFPHEFDLQLYDREIMINILKETEFKIVNEYRNYEYERWNGEDDWIVEAVKL